MNKSAPGDDSGYVSGGSGSGHTLWTTEEGLAYMVADSL